jgi:D-3-phosphoglycerate dehydrogenase
MKKVLTLNKISPVGLKNLPNEQYEVSSECKDPDAIILRSFKMHDMELPPTLKAVARAGAGVNNIPVDKCTEKGIVVFNTPGANANAVKELVILGLLMSCRKVYQGVTYAKSLAGQGDAVSKTIEKNKSQFKGPEILGKKLGLLGLGAIGRLVADSASALGMEVTGYDPYLSEEAKKQLPGNVKLTDDVDALLAESDFISLHMPQTDETKGFINAERLAKMKQGVRIVNFARGGLVDDNALIKALDDGQVNCYVTDFVNDTLLKSENVIPIPHLGASTPEAEDNCATMAANQLREYFENSNIVNSVNFPAGKVEAKGA